MIYLVGPGHGGQTAVTNAYLDGTYSEVYPKITKNEEGYFLREEDVIKIGKDI